MAIEPGKAEAEEFDLYEMDREPRQEAELAEVSSVEFIIEVLDLLGSGSGQQRKM